MESSDSFKRQPLAQENHELCAFALLHQVGSEPVTAQPHRHPRSRGMTKAHPARDGGTLAEALGVSDDAVWRILRKEGIQLRRMRSWCVSTDPEFAAKAADIIGLYLGPPTNAVVLSVDEKPSIQAVERKTGYVQTSSGKILLGKKTTYKRHGTVNLDAALNVATGEWCKLPKHRATDAGH